MKKLMLSTALAAGLGALALSPASAGMLGKSAVVAPSATSDVDCRTVERRTTRHGVTKITRTRECSDDRRSYRDRDRYDRDDRYVERREYRDRDRDRPGLSIQLPR